MPWVIFGGGVHAKKAQNYVVDRIITFFKDSADLLLKQQT